ncbi:MAG: hypothetical protein WAX69_06895 [Victivallales bacterium]
MNEKEMATQAQSTNLVQIRNKSEFRNNLFRLLALVVFCTMPALAPCDEWPSPILFWIFWVSFPGTIIFFSILIWKSHKKAKQK